ncbi:MAG: hypothetical protein ACI8Z9_001178, partial [Paraglaciecola sp.]
MKNCAIRVGPTQLADLNKVLTNKRLILTPKQRFSAYKWIL